MTKIKFTCPCCKKAQIILFDEDTGKVIGVLFNDEDSNIIDNYQEDLEQELFKKQNILLG